LRLWVGYDEDDNVKVDLIFPATETALIDDNDGPTERDLETIEQLAYETSHLLDKDVPSFAHGIYSYLAGITPHPSFIDPLWDQWQNAKQASRQTAASYKVAQEQTQVVAREKKKEKDQKSRNLKVANWRDSYARQQQMVLEAWKRQQEALRLAELEEAEPDPDSVEASLFKGLETMPIDRHLKAYLIRVVAISSPYLLWLKQGLESVPSVVVRLPWLQEVNLSENSLSTLPKELMTLPALKRLYLHSNQLTTLPDLSGVPLLEILDLHDNQLSILPSSLTCLNNLQMLDLERNKIRLLPAEIGDLAKLHHLNLARNCIKVIPSTLPQLKNLSFLNLRLNPIANLPPHIYVQGTGACMTYLREQTIDMALVQPSSLISDFSLLWSGNSSFLADIVLRSNQGKEQKKFPVHTVIIASRCYILLIKLLSAQKSRTALPIDPQSGLPCLDLDLDEEQLTILLNYIYTDRYTKPDLPLLSTAPSMTESEIIEIVKQNQEMTMAFTESLNRASSTAVAYHLPHLKYLIDINLRAIRKLVESTYIKDFTTVHKHLLSSVTPDDLLLKLSNLSNSTKEMVNAPSIDPETRLVQPDVTFTFPTHPSVAPIGAHKIVLCARSEFFKSLLTGGLAESQEKIVPVKEIEPAVFKSLIEFCYTDDVYELSAETIMDLLTASRLYGLERLQGIVESVIGYSLDAENVAGILSLSILYSLTRLGKACKFFILSNWEKVTHSLGWAELDYPTRDKFNKTARNWGIIKDE
jgi:hypothetical protein